MTVTGVFPMDVPVYVWFGDLAIVRGVVTPYGVDVVVPSVPTPGRVDVHVKFRTYQDLSLTLPSAFTFTAGGAAGSPAPNPSGAPSLQATPPAAPGTSTPS